jgi:16S rRNA (cytosine967-C5)-methyltransferase
VRELAAVQANLLRHAAAAVKPGGRLVYAVCTLTRAETTAVADAFTAAHAGFVPAADAPPALRELGAPPAPGQWLLRPERTGGSGMFIAVWRRSPARAGG